MTVRRLKGGMLGRLTASAGEETTSTSKRGTPGAEVRVADRDDAELRQRTREALAGQAVDDIDLDAVVAELAALRGTANAMQARVVDAGRRLAALREKTGETGFKALHAAGLIPFSEAAAYKLVGIAAAVEAHKLPIERMPRAIEAAYLVAKLSEPSLQRLIGAGVVKPEATVKEIRDAVRPPRLTKPGTEPLTSAERRRLERQRDRLLAEVARIEKRLAAG
jgi:hypothetical protein